MWPFRYKPQLPEKKPPTPEKRNLHSTDDILTRSDNIVWALGIRGSTGDCILKVHDLLKKYEGLDARAKEKDPAATPSVPGNS